MLNLSRIQLELERAKEKLRNVEETIQKVEGKTFSNGPVRYGGLKAEYHPDKTRNPAPTEDIKNSKRRVIASTIDARIQRLPTEDSPFGLKRGIREKREPGLGFKKQGGDARPQGIFARLSGALYHQIDEEDEDDFGKKPSLPSRVYTTATEVPSRQEVIAAQAQDEQSKERNKRMFGALVGTLQKFRKEETRVREREEKRMKVEKKLEEDAQREKEKLMQEKRELFLEKKRREVEIKRIEWSLNRVKEYEAWEANVLPLKNFIQTQAKPHIFYLPSAHNTKTEERLAHSQKLVERMIEKRKTNLKEEIENSEKKARKVAAEDAEEEEAENIPADNEEHCNAEKPIQIDFESKNKENGFFKEENKNQAGNLDNLDKAKETVEEEPNWDNVQECEKNDPVESVLENEKKISICDKELSKKELPVTDRKDSTNDLNSISEESLCDKVGEEPLGESGERNDIKMCETRERDEVRNESNEMNVEKCACGSLEENSNAEVPLEEIEGTEKIHQEPNTTNFAQSSDNKNKHESEQPTEEKSFLSESEPKIEDNSTQKLESEKEKVKTDETSICREKSQSRKSSRRSRSVKRSCSPRNLLKNKRRRPDSRLRVSRRRSSSSSPIKSRRSRSPLPRRGQRNFSSRKRSPHTKSRRFRSSSQSSSSVSPKKKRSRSASARSKSD